MKDYMNLDDFLVLTKEEEDRRLPLYVPKPEPPKKEKEKKKERGIIIIDLVNDDDSCIYEPTELDM